MSKIQTIRDSELERRLLGGIISNGEDAWIEIEHFVSEKDFVNSDNKILFRICRALLEEQKTLDSVIISSRCRDQGLTIERGNVTDFIENLLLAPLNTKGTVDAAKELKMITLRRDKVETARDIARFSSTFEGSNVQDFISGADEIYARDEAVLTGKHDPVDIAANAYAMVEQLRNEEGSYMIKTPWDSFNRSFGGFRPKDSYCFAGRPSHGKSGVLLYLAQYCSNMIEENFIDGKRLPVLYLDTEQEHHEQTLRWAACVANVSPFMIEDGSWAKNKEAVKRIREVLKQASEMHSFDHVYVPRLDTAEIRSIIRKWVRKKVGKDGVGIIVYDYLKITGDELKSADTPRLAVGHKLDVLKDEIKENTNCVFLFGAQRNRYGSDDDSSIAESDYIQQLSTWTGLIKKKNMEELAELPREVFGSHSLIPTKWRKLGKDGQRFEIPVMINGKYTTNWINIDFENFRFHDRGDGYDVQSYLELQEKSTKDSSKKPQIQDIP